MTPWSRALVDTRAAFASLLLFLYIFFFFNDTATTEIYTLSLHDALPILSHRHEHRRGGTHQRLVRFWSWHRYSRGDRKSTRLNSSHSQISYAVFCLKKKTKIKTQILIIT